MSRMSLEITTTDALIITFMKTYYKFNIISGLQGDWETLEISIKIFQHFTYF